MKKRKRTNKKFFFSFQKSFNKHSLRRIRQNIFQKSALALGLILIGVGVWLKISTPHSLSFDGQINIQNTVKTQTSLPVGIEIPSISVNLPVEESIIQNGLWSVSKTGVSHLASSSVPGNSGNVILYGHNTVDKLGSLSRVKIGDNILVKTQNGTTYTFKIKSIETVEPTDIDKLNEHEGETLTIYTCTGFADLKRLLVKAERV